MEYTHTIKIFHETLKCFLYKNIPEDKGLVYIRTEDNRTFWCYKYRLTEIRTNKQNQ